MAIDLAKLQVALEANSAQFTREMEKVNGRLDRFEKRANSAIRGIGRAFSALGAAISVGAITAFIKSSANMVSEQRAMAESVGLTTSKFSALNYAARQNSLSQDDLGKSLAKLNILLGDAANGEEKAEAKLKKFGITADMVRSGAVGTDDALRKIADRFAALPNGIEKTSLAAGVFGDKSGPKLVQFLNLGSKGLDEFARQGELAGAVITDKVADAVARANDQLAALYQTIQTKVLVGLAAFFGLVEANEGDKKLEELAEQISDLEGEMARLAESSERAESGGILGALLHTDDAARIAEIRNQLVLLRSEREKLKQEQMARFGEKPAATPRFDASGSEKLKKEAEAAAKAQAALEAYGREWHALVQEQKDKETWDFEDERDFSVAVDQAARNIQSFTASMVDAALAGEDMGDVIVASLRRIAAEMITAAALQGLGNWLGGFGGFWGQVGTSLAGKRADGGPVSGGKSYLVGEAGPELFTPRVSGAIIPNDALGGGGSVTIQVDARGADPASAANILRAMSGLEMRIYERLGRGTAPGAA